MFCIKKNLLTIIVLLALFLTGIYFIYNGGKISLISKAAVRKIKTNLQTTTPTPTIPAGIPPTIILTNPNNILMTLGLGGPLPDGLARSITVNGMTSRGIVQFPELPSEYWYLMKYEFTGLGRSELDSQVTFVFFNNDSTNPRWLKFTNNTLMYSSYQANIKAITSLSSRYGVTLPSSSYTLQVSYRGAQHMAFITPNLGESLRVLSNSGIDKNTLIRYYQQALDNSAWLLVNEGVVVRDANFGNFIVYKSGTKTVVFPIDFQYLDSQTRTPTVEMLEELEMHFKGYAKASGLDIDSLKISSVIRGAALSFSTTEYVFFRTYLNSYLIDLSVAVGINNISPGVADSILESAAAQVKVMSAQGSIERGSRFFIAAPGGLNVEIKVAEVTKIVKPFSFSSILGPLNIVLLFLPGIVDFPINGAMQIYTGNDLATCSTLDQFAASTTFSEMIVQTDKQKLNQVNVVDGFVKGYINVGTNSYFSGPPNSPPNVEDFFSNKLIDNILLHETGLSGKELYSNYFSYNVNYNPVGNRYPTLRYNGDSGLTDKIAWLYQSILFFESVRDDIVKNTSYPFPVYMSFGPPGGVIAGTDKQIPLWVSKYVDNNVTKFVLLTKQSETSLQPVVSFKKAGNTWIRDYVNEALFDTVTNKIKNIFSITLMNKSFNCITHIDTSKFDITCQ